MYVFVNIGVDVRHLVGTVRASSFSQHMKCIPITWCA